VDIPCGTVEIFMRARFIITKQASMRVTHVVPKH